MSLVACSCLNVVAGGECTSDSPIRLGNSTEGQWLRCYGGTVSCAEPALVDPRRRRCGEWILVGCMLCGQLTHATNPKEEMMLNMELQTDAERLASLRNDERFSVVFNVLVRETDGNVPAPTNVSHPALEALNRRLKSAVRAELELAEERVARFREEAFTRAESFRERATRDYQLIRNALPPLVVADPQLDAIGPEPTAQLDGSSARGEVAAATANRNVRTSFKKNDSKNASRILGQEEDSLDSEGIFDLEGMDSSGSPRDDHDSDAYDSDYDDSVSRDEGIHIVRNSTSESSAAKSLPVDVPNFTQAMKVIRDGGDQHPDDPHDIAASIRALARSVHGDVYELPRPRFSTQI